MKVVILAGGMQCALSSGREGIPKPMADIGGKPILWHIMKHFSEYGLNDFIVCGGYRVDMIKEYFMDFYIYQSDITVDLKSNTVQVHKEKTEDWKVTVVDTGIYSSTGQRVGMIRKYVDGDHFVVTYGDCLSDIDLNAMCRVHLESGRIATVAVAKPTGRNCLLPYGMDGMLHYENAWNQSSVSAWVNANCMMFHRDAFIYLQGNYDLEKQLFIKLSEKHQLAAYRHEGYWTAVETRRDLAEAENLWNAGVAPWIRAGG